MTLKPEPFSIENWHWNVLPGGTGEAGQVLVTASSGGI
jgi:hypothetical protein